MACHVRSTLDVAFVFVAQGDMWALRILLVLAMDFGGVVNVRSGYRGPTISTLLCDATNYAPDRSPGAGQNEGLCLT